jgi:hypothetical protein
MTSHSDNSHLSDICLLLRAHGEQLWLTCEVLPVLRQLERREGLPEEQLGAAIAYLEVLWIEASQRAKETDAAHAQLDGAAVNGDRALNEEARGYHAAVCSLRSALAHRVKDILAVPDDLRARELASS